MIPYRLYHLSKTPISIGAQLEPRFIRGHEDLYRIVSSGMEEGTAVLKGLLLADTFLAITALTQDRRLPIVVKEIVFELIRRGEFPSKRSRFEAVFLCADRSAAMRYVSMLPDHYLHVYLCSIEGGVSASADLQWVTPVADPLDPIQGQIEFLEDQARRYWGGQMSDEAILEVVTTGRVTVVQEETI